MKRLSFYLLVNVLFTLSFAQALQAEVRLADIFTSNMVLQRDRPLPIWGDAAPNESVTVTFDSQSQSATADAQGEWKVVFPPQKAGGPHTMVVEGNNEIVLSNVLVGEVWLCSGQSNMEWWMYAIAGPREHIRQANHPTIRLFQVKNEWNQMSQKHLTSTGWQPCTPDFVEDFSAVAYFFGRKLSRELGVPVGLINASWGGTRIEPWTPSIGFDKIAALKAIADEVAAKDPLTALHKQTIEQVLEDHTAWITELKENLAAGKQFKTPPEIPQMLMPYQDHQQPTVIYNAMIAPIVPLAIRGVIWYQGEANLLDGKRYADKMQALVEGWRTVFGQQELPFYFVQLAPFNYNFGDPTLLPVLWETQAQMAKTIPNTGMAVINDIGDLNDIHPREKEPVGERLAFLALNRTYDKKEIDCDSPAFLNFEVDGDSVVVRFEHAKGLKTRDGKAPDWFEVAGADGVFKPATAVIDGESVKLAGIQPYAVRFAWSQFAEPNIVNGAGLPMSAFRAGIIPERAMLDTLVPEAKNFRLLYSVNPIAPTMSDDKTQIIYTTDNSREISGAVKRVAYFLYLKPKDGEEQFVFVTMPPLSQTLEKLGIPTKASGAQFQTVVNDVTVKSNVSGIENGTFADGFCVEFCDCNYGPRNAAEVVDASDEHYDFGDEMLLDTSPGYGSMQIHHFAKKQTVLAFNGFIKGAKADVGIGNNPSSPHTDWTFSNSAGQYEGGSLMVLIEVDSKP